MWATLHNWYGIPWVHGAVHGFGVAFGVDLREFLAGPDWNWRAFNWSKASKRWVTGAVFGSGLSGAIGL